MARALLSDDPAGAFRAASLDEAHSPALRHAFGAAASQGDGLVLAALLVVKLRFERLLRGSPQAEAWFARAPGDFAEAFRKYHREIVPTAFFPQEEAMLFEAWARRTTPP